jgi:hypothetical protein
MFQLFGRAHRAPAPTSVGRGPGRERHNTTCSPELPCAVQHHSRTEMVSESAQRARACARWFGILDGVAAAVTSAPRPCACAVGSRHHCVLAREIQACTVRHNTLAGAAMCSADAARERMVSESAQHPSCCRACVRCFGLLARWHGRYSDERVTSVRLRCGPLRPAPSRVFQLITAARPLSHHASSPCIARSSVPKSTNALIYPSRRSN